MKTIATCSKSSQMIKFPFNSYNNLLKQIIFQTLVHGISISSYVSLLDKELLDRCVLIISRILEPSGLMLFSPGDRVDEEEFLEEPEGEDNLFNGVFLHCVEDVAIILFLKV